MKTLMLLPDGIGIRNFVLTQFLKSLVSTGTVVIWYAVSENSVKLYREKWNGLVTWHPLPIICEDQPAFLFRRAKMMAQLYWQSEPGTDEILEYMNQRSGSGLRGLRNLIANNLGRAASFSHKHILQLDQSHAAIVCKSKYFFQYVEFLQREKPDVVFCSHQRSEKAVPAMLAARKIGIPTATFIYSWDNLPKGRMAVHADYFLVWSEHMKEEMRQYYPDVSEERIFIIGTPQFEHYFNPAIILPREDFLRQNALDPSRPVVCFSGDDLTTSPFDQDYLADLAEAMRQVPGKRRPQVLFRRNPTDVSDRYQNVLQKYPEIAISEPRWAALENNDWSKVVPTPEDTDLLVNIVNHCDLVVNVGSTMALDFAILDKPALYLAYNPTSWTSDCQWSIDKVYRYPHFNHIHQFEPVYWVRSKDDLKRCVLHALENPSELQAAREQWVNFLVQTPLDQASLRCARALQRIGRME